MTQPAVMDGYIRVSRRMGREGPGYISPNVQREAITRWADYRGVRIDRWEIDEDESGGTQDRPGLRRIMERIEAGETGGVACWRLNRFARNVAGAIGDVEHIQAAGGVLAFVEEDIDPTGPFGDFILKVLLAVAELELNNVKAGWKVAKARAISRGVHIGPTPLGYVRAPGSTLEVDPDRGQIVSDAFTAAARDGLAAAESVLRARVPERTWSAYTVRRLLANRTYLGEVRYGPELVSADAHPALVSRAVFEGAQHEPTGQRRPRGDFPLSGVASCGTCGARMVGARGGADGRRMYRCGPRCDRPAVVSADLLEAHVVAVLRAAFEHPGFRVGTESPDIADAEGALLEAEAELDEFAGDTQARRLLGHRYHAALEKRVGEVDEARERLRAALAVSAQTRVIVPAELWDSLEPAELAEVLRGGLDAVIVRRGRLPIGERVTVVPKGTHGGVVPVPEDL